MSFEAIEQEISSWDLEKLRKLQALVVSLRRRLENPEFAMKMAQLIDDRDPAKWVTLEEFEKRLGFSPEAQ